MIVETKNQFDGFIKKYNKSDSIVIPILMDKNLHPLNTELSLLYVNLIGESDYILAFDHTEANSLPIEYLSKLNNKKVKYTFNKKELNHIISWKNVVDINLCHYMKTNQPLHIDELGTNAHNYFNSTFYHKNNINRIIPILKHLEYCRELAKLLEKEIDEPFDKYNDDVIDVLTYIENSGVRVNPKYVGKSTYKHITKDGKYYTEYNIYTSTGRPSNRFGGVNFSALNKKDDSRKALISRFGKDGVLVEFDFNSFHPRLIANVIGHKLPKGSVYEYLSNFYNVSYEEAKSLTFQYLYGRIPDDVRQLIPFFDLVQSYIDIVWTTYKTDNFIKSDIYNKRIYRKNLQDMNKTKLFNYSIQLMETERNMKIMNKLIPMLDSYKSKLILYNYDSLLFDFCMDDKLDFLKMVKNEIEENDKFPTRVSWGTDYKNMKDITEKFSD